MSAHPEDFLRDRAQVDHNSIQPLPNSRKIYVTGSRPDLRLRLREVTLSDTPTAFCGEPNPPVLVYDTSGPYTDPAVAIDVRQGLAPIRSAWIEERADTEVLEQFSSEFTRRRLLDPALDPLRFGHHRLPRRARAGANVTQMHYARKGIITPEMEFVAIRENMKLQEAREQGLLAQQHSGDRKSTRLNSSHVRISYAVFCLKKKKKKQ